MTFRGTIRLVVVSLGLVAIGGALALYGLTEKWAAEGTTPDPVEADLARMEAGDVPANRHVRVGPHLALYFGTVSSFKTRNRIRPKAEANTSLPCRNGGHARGPARQCPLRHLQGDR